jgi:hypothetical protein
VAPPVPSPDWVADVRQALAGFRKVAVGQLVPADSRYELVLTTLHSPPEGDLVEQLSNALGSLIARSDSPVMAVEDSGTGETAWHWYPALDEPTRQLFSRLDWKHAILVHERLD